MEPAHSAGLNDPGENVITRVFEAGAVHVSSGSSTHPHAHYAWKIHIGLDAPVWFESSTRRVELSEGCRAVIVPPGLEHRVGAMGLACTAFAAPGSRGTSWHTEDQVRFPGASVTARLLSIARSLTLATRACTSEHVEALFRASFCDSAPPVDPRVKRALSSLRADPNQPLEKLAASSHLSADRLSHLVKQGTGVTLRTHAVWSRLLWLLSQGRPFETLAEAAAEAGFSDHAHLTRTYRRFLGRLPSEFSGPPDVVEPW